MQGVGMVRIVVLVLVLTAVILPTTIATAERRVSFGVDERQFRDVVALADWLNERPVATVVYDHWLGWELGYYMGAWTDKRRVYYPTPRTLVEDALALDDDAPRYLPTPKDAQVGPWLRALHEAGFAVTVAWENDDYVVYALSTP